MFDLSAPACVASVGSPQPFTLASANAATTNNITIPAIAGKTIYVKGFEITGGGATSTSIISVTITNCANGAVPQAAQTITYSLVIPSPVTAAITPLQVEYSAPIVCYASNTSMVFAVPSFGAGNTNASVVIHGFYM